MREAGMRTETARVVSQARLTCDIFELMLETALAREVRPGQFVALYCSDQARLLPRPISVCDSIPGENRLRLVYRVVGEGTGELARLQTGSYVRILGNLGNGFDLLTAAGKRVLITGGGVGIPPLLFLSKELRRQSGEKAPVHVTIALGYRNSETFLLERFRESGEVLIASDDGSVGVKGTVMDAIRREKTAFDVVFACGPMPMLRALAAYSEETRCEEKNIKCYVSLEERMACGVGACLGCVVKTKATDAHSRVCKARVCTEGPVFDAEEIAW